jgi:hypothetical protein
VPSWFSFLDTLLVGSENLLSDKIKFQQILVKEKKETFRRVFIVTEAESQALTGQRTVITF